MRQQGTTRRLATLAVVAAVQWAGLGTTAAPTTSAEVQRFENLDGIAIADSTTATPYPSTIAVRGFETEVAHVAVGLINYSHTFPEDTRLLLAGPDGQNAIIMANVGGLNVVNNQTITLDDRAAMQLQQGTQLATGTFRPANHHIFTYQFPSPAPTSTGSGSALAVFNGTNPNGDWSLFAVDVGAGGSGDIEAWSLTVTTENGPPEARPDKFKAKAGNTLSVKAPGVLKNDRDPDNDPVRVVLARKPKQGTVVLRPDGRFTYRADKDAKGTDSFTYRVQDSSGLTDTSTVRIKIKAGNGRR